MSEPRLLGDRYELGEVVGRGGMAEVWRGRDIRLGRVVALKMLRVDHAADATFQERFRREAQSAASLNHRNIVAVYDTGEDYIDGHRIPYIVMEYVEGHTLREMLRDQARFTPERSIEVMAATLDALEYSHRAGIVHRDIKPGNIMITTAGEVKVMDFGIARSLSDTQMSLTQTAAVVGTAQYISPEQARGEQADTRSDLYATGCVLYELLTGRPPFVGDSLVSVAVSHVREIAALPSSLDPTVPHELDAIVMKSLAKDRRERYQSAYEMRADLQRAAAGLPVAAAADVTASTQMIAPTTTAPAYADTGQFDEQPYDDEPEDDRRGIPWWAVALLSLIVLGAAAFIGYQLFKPDGAEQVNVPRVLTMSYAEASAALQDEGLVAERGPDRTVQNENQIDKVVAQDPPPNETLKEGGTVTLTVGVAPERVPVPDVEGMTRAEAVSALEGEELSVSTTDQTQETDDEELVDTVASTDPAAGEEVEVGTEITLTMYALSEQVQVPQVAGSTVDSATQAIEDAGLRVAGEPVEETSDQPEGTVTRTDPAEGSSVDRDTEVTIYVSSGPEEEEVTVPSVIGQDEDQARAILEPLQLVVETEDSETCDAPDGQVIDQDPKPNSKVEPGDTVTILIAREPVLGCDTPGGGNEDG